jgi:ribosome biogenesis protein Tsr3
MSLAQERHREVPGLVSGNPIRWGAPGEEPTGDHRRR